VTRVAANTMWYEEVCSADCGGAVAVESHSPPFTHDTPRNHDVMPPTATVQSTTNAGLKKEEERRQQQFTPVVDLPQNLYWAIPGELIGMGCPLKRKHIENLHNIYGVVLVVNLRECATPHQLFTGTPVKNIHIPIKSFGVPTPGQAEQFIAHLQQTLELDNRASDEAHHNNNHNNKEDDNTNDDCDSKRRRVVAVNCRGGKGRTGTMVACYLVHREGITAQEAILRIRELSPTSLETRGQEEFVEEFYRLKMVNGGREGEYTRSLPYPFAPQLNNGRTEGVKMSQPKPIYPCRGMLFNHPYRNAYK